MGRRLLVKNSDGQIIKLNRTEKAVANFLESSYGKFINSLGFEIPITTLTTVIKKVTEQRFFQIAPDDYVPVRVGEGAWSTQLTTFREYATGGTFDLGIINTANQNDRLATADAGVDAINVPIYNWAKQVTYSLFELNFAIKNSNWDLVEARQRSRKKNWDLGIQELAFLGIPSLANSTNKCYGLLNQPGVSINNTVITLPISAMNPTQLATFVGAMLTAYRQNVNHTVWPNRLVIPESDWNVMANPASSQFPVISRLALLLEQLRTVTKNPGFEILPSAYSDPTFDPTNSNLAIALPTYVLYNYDQDSIRMDIPVDYTATVQNSINGFQFQNVGYGQFSGVNLYRPLELMYFVISPTP